MVLPRSIAQIPNTAPTQKKLMEKSPAPARTQTKDLAGYLKRNVIK